jgi:hypothetical protein
MIVVERAAVVQYSGIPVAATVIESKLASVPAFDKVPKFVVIPAMLSIIPAVFLDTI